MRPFPCFASASFAVFVLACGGGGKETPPPASPNAAADAGAATKGNAMTPPPNVTLPAERAVPVTSLGSKIAKVRGKNEAAGALGDAPMPACVQSGNNLGALVKACAASAKPVGAATSVNVSDAQGAANVPMSAEANACYRVLAVGEGGVESFVVVVLDSKGMVAVEARTGGEGKSLVVPAEGPLCFGTADAAKVVVSAGRGAGRVGVQIVRE